ncbi:MAG: hypothetical protein JHC21_03525 [Thermocrinis sp.]|nr:hypothetical protein [Thermocrinis sp.]
MKNIRKLFLLSALSFMLMGGKWAFATDVGAMLKAMADPAGAPFFPVVMQVLQVLTFTLHMLFVYTAIGGLFFSIYGFTKSEERWKRFAKATLELAKVSVSLAVVLGVAPLLFYQVIYDPLWYTSANLSAWWYVLFIILLIIGYYFVWGAYFTKDKPSMSMLLSILGVLFLLFVGFIIHVVNYQSLFPEKWVEWYTDGGRTMNTSGWNIYAFNVFRYLSFLVFPSVAITGAFIMLYNWYFRNREDMDKDYLDWAGKVGARFAMYASIGWLVSHILYIFTIPADWGAKESLLTWLSVLGIVLYAGVLFTSQKNPVNMAIPSTLTGFIAILLIAIFREYLRIASTARFGYSIYNYKLNLEFLSPLLFFGTLLAGLIIYAYGWWMAYRAGKTPKGKVYEATETEHNLGDLSVFVALLWTIVWIGVGLIVIARNYG